MERKPVHKQYLVKVAGVRYLYACIDKAIEAGNLHNTPVHEVVPVP